MDPIVGISGGMLRPRLLQQQQIDHTRTHSRARTHTHIMQQIDHLCKYLRKFKNLRTLNLVGQPRTHACMQSGLPVPARPHAHGGGEPRGWNGPAAATCHGARLLPGGSPARSEGESAGHAIPCRPIVVLLLSIITVCAAVPAVRQVGNPVQRDPSVCSEEEYKNFLLAYIDLRYLDYRRAAREGLRLRA